MDLVAVKTCSNPVEAHLFRIELLAWGIEASIRDEYIVGMNILYTIAIGGVKVQIRPEDLPLFLSTPGLSDGTNYLRGTFYQRFFDAVVESKRVQNTFVKVLIGLGIIIAGLFLTSRIETSIAPVKEEQGRPVTHQMDE